jgi:hypothetical protein
MTISSQALLLRENFTRFPCVLGCVVPLEPLNQAAGFLSRKGFIERGWLVRAEIVLHEHDLAGLREVRVGQFLQHLCIVDTSVTVGHLDLTPTFQDGVRERLRSATER